jgi:hypothetical protein
VLGFFAQSVGNRCTRRFVSQFGAAESSTRRAGTRINAVEVRTNAVEIRIVGRLFVAQRRGTGEGWVGAILWGEILGIVWKAYMQISDLKSQIRFVDQHGFAQKFVDQHGFAQKVTDRFEADRSERLGSA